MSVAINRPCGELWRHNDTSTLTLETLGQWYPTINLLEGITRGLKYLNGDTDGRLIVPTGMQGLYRIEWVSSAAGETGKTYELGISINGIIQEHSAFRRKMGSADVGSMAGSCMLDIPADAQIRLCVRCIDFSNVSLTLIHTNLSVIKV